MSRSKRMQYPSIIPVLMSKAQHCILFILNPLQYPSIIPVLMSKAQHCILFILNPCQSNLTIQPLYSLDLFIIYE